jgi:hypothetical protein
MFSESGDFFIFLLKVRGKQLSLEIIPIDGSGKQINFF